MTSINISNAEHMGVMLKGIRKAMGLTQGEFSELVGLNQCGLCRTEIGLSKPSLTTLIKIADAIGKDLIIEFREREEEKDDVPNSSMDQRRT